MDGRTGENEEGNIRFSQFCERLKKKKVAKVAVPKVRYRFLTCCLFVYWQPLLVQEFLCLSVRLCTF